MKIIHPDGRGESPGRSRSLSYGRFERYGAPYFQMACGHWTTAEIQDFWSLWRPKGKPFYCEHWPKPCGWQKAMPKPKPKPLPDEPMF